MIFDVTKTLTPEISTYLEDVEWGYEKSLRYKIQDRQSFLESAISQGELRILRQDNCLAGTIFSLHKQLTLDGHQEIKARYETLLSVAPTFHGQGFSKRLIESAKTSPEEAIFHYAYVEEKNIPSARAFRSTGYEPLGTFLATTFNRLSPKRSERVRRLEQAELPIVKKALVELYRGHSFLDFDQSFDSQHYWVIREQNRIIGGVQIEEERWRITFMPGIEGWFAVHVLPFIPGLNRILNPRNIAVLKIGNLFIPEGHEMDWMELVLHLTSVYRKDLALAYLDPRSPIYQRLKHTLKFGLFNRLFETPVTIWGHLPTMSTETRLRILQRPFVISPMDLS